MPKKTAFYFVSVICFNLLTACTKHSDTLAENKSVFEADIDGRHWTPDSVKACRYPGEQPYGFNRFLIIAFTNGGEAIQLNTKTDLPSSEEFKVVFTQFHSRFDIGNSNDVVLEWQTASEENTLKFNIERSTDGTNFVKVGEVPASGNTNGITNYSWREKPSLLNSTYYYSLREEDTDNAYWYSSLISIKLYATALYFSSDSDTAYHYGFNGNITVTNTDTILHKVSGTFFFDYVDDGNGLKHTVRNGFFKDVPY